MTLSAQNGTTRRKRRSAEEISERLLRAAGDAFEEHGFSGATTAMIASRADVTEAQLFRSFGSKVELFREAVFEPLNQHFSDFQSRYGDATETVGTAPTYIVELRRFLSEHSGQLMALFVAQTYSSGDVGDSAANDSLGAYFERCASMMSARVGQSPRVEPRLMVRVAFAAMLACVMFRDWIFTPGLADEKQIDAAIIDFIIDGLSANPDPGLRDGAA